MKILIEINTSGEAFGKDDIDVLYNELEFVLIELGKNIDGTTEKVYDSLGNPCGHVKIEKGEKE